MSSKLKWSVKLKGLIDAISRYPLTTAFLLLAAATNAVAIHTEKSHSKWILTCAVGAILCAAMQAAWERFFSKMSQRLVIMTVGILLTMGYYLIIRTAPGLSEEIGIRTSAALLALFFAFMWVPVIKSKVSFNESFMAVFKGFFHSLFYAAILFAGCALVIAAIDLLITNVNEKAYMHTANLVFVLFAPIFFLSRIPVYPRVGDKVAEEEVLVLQEEAIAQAAFCPKFLEVLISYIIIPLTAVYTVILLLYIALNIRGEFWSNNLLEPLLVSYAITVIIVYLLASRINNHFANLYRLIFPKVLVPLVVFQIVSSVLSLQDTGITHTRYYVILFGIFAAFAGIVMSVVPVRKNGILAGLLIGFCIWSIIPPVDAFTISRYSQEKMLWSVLVKNEMLENNKIKPKDSISDEDKKKIVLATEYLYQMEYTDRIAWLPKDFNAYEDFYDTFGFYEYQVPEKENRTVYVSHNLEEPIDIAGYDILTKTFINANDPNEVVLGKTQQGGVTYTILKMKNKNMYDLVLQNQNKQEIIRFDTNEIFSRYRSYAVDKTQISNEEASFVVENEMVKMMVVVQEANIGSSLNDIYYYADLYVLVKFK